MLEESEVNQLLNEFAQKVKNQYNIEPTQEITGVRFVRGIDICVEIDEDANYFNLSLIKVLSAIIDENKELKTEIQIMHHFNENTTLELSRLSGEIHRLEIHISELKEVIEKLL